MRTIKIFALLMAIVMIGQSCRKDNDEITVTPPTIEPEIIVTGSVLGTVVDDNGNAIEGATVTFEDQIIFTDDNGVFQFNNEQLYANGTYIQVSKEGYFDGSRRFYASEENTAIINIELIPLKKIGEFNSSEGLILSFESVSLAFEANSIMNEDRSPYSGNVNVAAKYLDPTLHTTYNQMPGDLTGIASDMNRVVLTSMAMIAVELYDDNGNELQIQEGKTVGTKIPVPETLVSDAPSEIPMWYFDEGQGFWVEEGSAILVEGQYETDLAHFSFWNCDIPNDFVFLKGRVTNRGIPVQNMTVAATVSNGGTSASDITNAEGYFCGYVPQSQDLKLTFFDKCGNVVHSVDIPAAENDIVLDPVDLIIETGVASITGSVTYCDGTPSAQTYVSIRQGDLNNIVVPNNDFTFSDIIFYCDNNSEILVNAVDPVNVVISDVSSFSLNENIEIGEIELCEDNGQLVDPRDGQKYLITEIGDQIWTAENMRYDTDDGISEGYDVAFNSVPQHYGRLYNYHSAQEACPDGWHLPSRQEFLDLDAYLGANGLSSSVGLKSIEDWDNNGNGTNSTGFNAFPVGIVTQNGGDLDYTGRYTSFWSSTSGQGMTLSAENSDIAVSSSSTWLSFSVRCLKD